MINEFSCRILGIKNSVFFKRNILQSIDWDLINKFKYIKSDIKTIKKELNYFKEEFKEELNNVKTKVDKIDKIEIELIDLKKTPQKINSSLNLLLNPKKKYSHNYQNYYLSRKRKRRKSKNH